MIMIRIITTMLVTMSPIRSEILYFFILYLTRSVIGKLL